MTKNIRPRTTLLLLTLCTAITAQTVAEEIEAIPQRAAGLNYSLPADRQAADTPAPQGKLPFYISHYGCSAAYYLEYRRDYELPIATMAKADSLGKLTTLGQEVLQKLRLVYDDARDRSGELTETGARQIRQLTQQTIERFPSLFVEDCMVDARSIVRNHNILSMQEAMIQVSKACAPMKLYMKASHSNDTWMDVRDPELEAIRFNKETEASYKAFADANTDNRRLMASLFNDADYARDSIDATALADQLFSVAGSVQNTSLKGTLTLFDIFTPKELYQHWRIQNARHYISYGHFKTNGGNQAFSQRSPLWNLLHMGDSIMKLDYPVVHLRYSSRGMVTSLICLMELNGFGLQTDKLDELDKLGWTNYKIAPFGASVEVVHYRRDKDDDDILIKVLLNGQETQLPITTDCAPYYHWQDVKRYYLRKVYGYEKQRYDNQVNQQDN